MNLSKSLTTPSTQNKGVINLWETKTLKKK